jgi:hypothetical protein
MQDEQGEILSCLLTEPYAINLTTRERGMDARLPSI